MCDLCRFWLFCLDPFVFLKILKLFGFQIFWLWAYPMKAIPEMPLAQYIWYLCFYAEVILLIFFFFMQFFNQIIIRGRRVRDRMWIGFTTAYTIIAYHHWTHILLRNVLYIVRLTSLNLQEKHLKNRYFNWTFFFLDVY